MHRQLTHKLKHLTICIKAKETCYILDTVLDCFTDPTVLSQIYKTGGLVYRLGASLLCIHDFSGELTIYIPVTEIV